MSLEHGVYTVPQAAYLARLHPTTLRRWIDTERVDTPAISRRLPDSPKGVVSFVDFIQLLAVRAIRRKKKVSLPKIRAVVQEAEKRGVEYPFARRHTIFLLGNDLALKINDNLIWATGKDRDQQLMEPIVEPYLDDLGWDSSGLANSFSPLTNGTSKIVLMPSQRLGAPVVDTCGYTVNALLEAVQSEGSIKNAAMMCEVEVDEIKLALRYDDSLSGVAS